MELSEANGKLAEAIKAEECIDICADMISSYMNGLDDGETPAMALAIAKNREKLVEQEMISIDLEEQEEHW